MDKTKKYQELKLSKHLKDNPLTKGFIISVSILNDKNNYIKDPNELGALYNPKQYQFERQINSKIYRSKFTKKAVLQLNSNAKNLFLWIMFEIQPKTDYIHINKADTSKELNISVKTLERAIKSLCSKINVYDVNIQILQISKEIDVYFINPAFIFSGDRKKKYPEKCKIYKPKSE